MNESKEWTLAASSVPIDSCLTTFPHSFLADTTSRMGAESKRQARKGSKDQTWNLSQTQGLFSVKNYTLLGKNKALN